MLLFGSLIQQHGIEAYIKVGTSFGRWVSVVRRGADGTIIQCQTGDALQLPTAEKKLYHERERQNMHKETPQGGLVDAVGAVEKARQQIDSQYERE